ncbi:MAG: hypothetical protein AAF191_20000, partial [Verrucomicrobiota bacterium]
MSSSQRGSTLIGVFWVLSVLGFAALLGVTVVVNQADSHATQSQVFRAEQLMERGVALGLHPELTEGDPLFQGGSEAEFYRVQLTSEAARFDLNALLRSGDSRVLEDVFEYWGLSLEEAQGLISAMQDWIDEDDLHRVNGAERDDYESAGFRGRPFNRPFASLDEVLLVRGMTAVEVRVPDWREWFTLWTSS